MALKRPDIPAWLQAMIDNPPPLITPEEAEADARSERAFQARTLLTRLPAICGSGSVEDLARRVSHDGIRELAFNWRPSDGNAGIIGETGLGKTTAIAIMVRRLFQLGVEEGGRAWDLARSVAWFRAQQLEQAVRRHALGRGDSIEFTQAVSAEVLVLDDAGWESDPKLTASVLAERYDLPRLTIITSGKDIPELREFYGDAVIRRMLTTRGRHGRLVRAFPTADAKREDENREARERGAPEPHWTKRERE